MVFPYCEIIYQKVFREVKEAFRFLAEDPCLTAEWNGSGGMVTSMSERK